MTTIAIVIVGGGIIFCLVGIGLSIDRVAKSLEQISRMMKGYWDNVDDMAEYIREQLTTDVAEVKHGKWVDNYNGTFACSVCGGKASKMNYCGNCGARMDGEGERQWLNG